MWHGLSLGAINKLRSVILYKAPLFVSCWLGGELNLKLKSINAWVY
ncbi:hypothetical protein F0Z19_4826 [Vibrio cyclitrophicus]|nr:hypothetical protein F0Z19_4826 [Vibrio cyclitrophicus]